MRTGGSRRLAWTTLLAISLGGGLLCVVCYFVVPNLGIHGLPDGKSAVLLLAPLTLVFASILNASFVDDRPRYVARLHRASAGIVGGAAFVFVLHALWSSIPISFAVVALGGVVGAVLAVLGLFEFVGRGL